MQDTQLISKLKKGGIVAIRDHLIGLQTNGAKVYRTESGDPSFNIPDIVKLSIAKSMSLNKTHYTLGTGIIELRNALYSKLKNKNKIHIGDSSEIIVTNGSMNALYCVYKSIVNGHNSRILVPTPTWTETFDNITAVGGIPIFYKIDVFNKEPINFDELENIMIDNKIEALVINSPHNPTGKVLNIDILNKIIQFCIKYDLYLISDEAYEHILFDENQHVSPGSLSDYKKIISVFSFSKSYAMSGLRLGYIHSRDKDLLQSISKNIRLTINGVNSITQWGGISAICDTPSSYIEENNIEYNKRRNILYQSIAQSKYLIPYKPEGAFYLWCKISDDWKPEITNDRSWYMALELLKLGIGSAPGDVFGPGGSNHIRFSFSCPTSDIEGVSQII